MPIGQDCPKQGMGLGLRADPSAICQGAVSRVSIAGRLPDGAVTQWSVNGEATGQSPTLEFGSTGRQPGSYRVSVKVTADGYNDASSDTNITVRPYVPATGTLTASPAEIYVGDNATLNPNFSEAECEGPEGRSPSRLRKVQLTAISSSPQASASIPAVPASRSR